MSIAIIGGGAAGMFAACAAAKAGAEVTLFERGKACGIKLNLTGKGRCNVTNNCELDALIQNTPRNGKFLYSAFAACPPEQVIAFFEGLGVPLKTERGNRVFPVSDSAKDITGALKMGMKRRGVRVLQARIARILTENGTVSGVETSDGASFPASRVIVATGGFSYPATGSDGDGYRLAEALGHTVTPTRPSLVPLVGERALCKSLEGLSLRNVGMEINCKGKVLYSEFGEMLFTAEGVSGPMVLSASAHLNEGQFPCRLTIDLKPALDMETLDRRILRDFNDNLNRDFSNSLGGLLPAKLVPVIAQRSGIPADLKVHSVTKVQREALCRLLKGFTLEMTGLGSYRDAVITSGGVDVRGINPKTMMSRMVEGLYFAGEVMDVDAYTGGFNLQIAWSTGHLAGVSAAWAEEVL